MLVLKRQGGEKERGLARNKSISAAGQRLARHLVTSSLLILKRERKEQTKAASRKGEGC